MVKRLKKSFVAITMLSAALVLLVLMGVVNLMNYVERTSDDRELLQYLVDNGGHFPAASGGSREPASSEMASSEDMNVRDTDEIPETAMMPEPGQPGQKGDHRRFFTPETEYETRFFSVFLREDGTVTFADTAQIAAVTGEEAALIAQDLQAAGRTAGRYADYRFAATPFGDGVMYVFLDCTRNIMAVRTFFLNSVIVTAAGLLVLLGLSWLLSGRAVRPIVESYEKQKSFITNAGHELKTPLAVIASNTEVIELENGESRWTQSIHGQIERMTRLTQDLVALARMDEDTSASMERADTDVSRLVADTVEPFAQLAETKGLGFSLHIQPDIVWNTNADALEKICAILADNAVKYASGDITFSLRKEGSRLVLREENPADDLTEGKQEKLFDRFYRADASRSSSQPGYGLGLPMARSLTEALGGKIQANSPDGKRLVMTVSLP